MKSREEIEIREDAVYRAFRAWCDTTPLRSIVEAEVLQECRKERGDPTWVPRALLNGGMAYSGMVNGRLYKLWIEEKKCQST